MSSIFPIRSDPSTGGDDPRVVDLEGEDADQVFGALSSETARRIVAELHDEPRTQSEIAEEIDSSVQNVSYHLDNLQDAGLVEVVDTWYSSRGNEMEVYAPADGALIVSGNERTASRIKTALSRLVGGVGVLAGASLLFQAVVERFGGRAPGPGTDDGAPTTASGGDGGGGDGAEAPGAESEDAPQGYGGTDDAERGDAGDGDAASAGADGGDDAGGTPSADGTSDAAGADAGTPTPKDAADATPTPSATETPTPDPTPVTDGGADVTPTPGMAAEAVETGANLPPGLLFFLGGVSVLVVVVAIWYWSGS